MSIREIVLQCVTHLLQLGTEKYCHSKLGIMVLFLLFACCVITSSTDPDPSATVCNSLPQSTSDRIQSHTPPCRFSRCSFLFWASCLLQFGYKEIKYEIMPYVLTQYLCTAFLASAEKESFSRNICQLMTA